MGDDGSATAQGSTERAVERALPADTQRAVHRRAHRGVHLGVVGVLATGLLITGILSAAAWSVHQSNEDRLLDQRTREAAAVLSAAVSALEMPLSSASEVVIATGGDEGAFRTFMTPLMGEGGSFASASLWRRGEEVDGPQVVLGEEPILASEPAEVAHDFFAQDLAGPELLVLDLLDSEQPRIGYSYAITDPAAPYVVYVEQALAADRTSARQPEAAFSDLEYALYLGPGRDRDQLIFASTDRLPLSGRTDTEQIPFGDTVLRLAMAPTESLGGGLIAALPWLIFAVGAVVSVGAAGLVERILRRRDHAEALVRELAVVAGDNARLYGEQRSVAQTLQQSLLLDTLPNVDGLEMSVRYEAGMEGVDIGGDWCDVIPTGDGRVLISVGDVSGRGVRAATVMARMRYSMRAYAAQGDDPATILTKLGALVSVERDGHFATALVAEVDPTARTITVANAGHPSPLLVDRSGTAFIETEIGLPVGVVAEPDYATVTVGVEDGTTVVLFTDGLFERRGETVDVGLERLRASVVPWTEGLEAMLDALMANAAGSHDDTAVLAVRWARP